MAKWMKYVVFFFTSRRCSIAISEMLPPALIQRLGYTEGWTLEDQETFKCTVVLGTNCRLGSKERDVFRYSDHKVPPQVQVRCIDCKWRDVKLRAVQSTLDNSSLWGKWWNFEWSRIESNRPEIQGKTLTSSPWITPVITWEWTTPMTTLEWTTPMTALEWTTPMTTLEWTTPMSTLEWITPILP